jgi:hypothetical protein
VVEAASSGRLLVVVVFLPRGGAPVGYGCGSTAFRRSQLGGAVLRIFPEPESVERRLRWLNKRKVLVMSSRSRTTTALQGGGSVELRPVDFPSVRGLLPIQGYRGGATAARPRHVFFGAGDLVVLRDWFVIFPFLVYCSVRILE